MSKGTRLATAKDNPARPSAAVEPISGAMGRRFALFAVILLIAHLLLPWFVEARGDKVHFWWNMLLDHRLPDAVLFQILWMGAALVGLAVAVATSSARLRGWSLVVVGTVGLLMEGWAALVRWQGYEIDLTDPANLMVVAAMTLLVLAALNAGQLRLAVLLPDRRVHRWIACGMGLLGVAAFLAMAWMALGSGQAMALMPRLLPRDMAGDYGRLALVGWAFFALLALALLIAVPVALLPARASILVSRTARRMMHLTVLVAPLLVAWQTIGVSPARSLVTAPVQLLEARIIAVYAVYWFALSLGGETILLLYDYRDFDESEEF